MTTRIDRTALQREIVSNPSYRLAEEDMALLGENDLRPLRLHLELVKAERVMREHRIGSSVVVFNITLPREQEPNPFITPDLAFRFHYFAIRKLHFALRAKAMVAFPGGFGTLDELFEFLTLVQTGKMPAIPIVLLGASFWRVAINFDFLLEEGMISASDMQLFRLVDTAEEALAVLLEFYGGRPPE